MQEDEKERGQQAAEQTQRLLRIFDIQSGEDSLVLKQLERLFLSKSILVEEKQNYVRIFKPDAASDVEKIPEVLAGVAAGNFGNVVT